MSLSTKEIILLAIVQDERNINENQLTSQQQEVAKALVEKQFLQEEEGTIRCSPVGENLIRIAKSGLNFNVLTSRMSNNALIKLADGLLKNGKERGIHWNVIFKQMSDEERQYLLDEMDIAMASAQSDSAVLN
jgi:hypothetical protein